MKKIKITLDAEDFQALISGGTVCTINTETKIEIEIILEDIGFVRMQSLVSIAMDENYDTKGGRKL